MQQSFGSPRVMTHRLRTTVLKAWRVFILDSLLVHALSLFYNTDNSLLTGLMLAAFFLFHTPLLLYVLNDWSTYRHLNSIYSCEWVINGPVKITLQMSQLKVSQLWHFCHFVLDTIMRVVLYTIGCLVTSLASIHEYLFTIVIIAQNASKPVYYFQETSICPTQWET